jgi:hypothetical protein
MSGISRASLLRVLISTTIEREQKTRLSERTRMYDYGPSKHNATHTT